MQNIAPARGGENSFICREILAVMRILSSRLLASVLVLFSVVVIATVPVQAAGKSVVVIGDSLAEGLYTGLYQLLKAEPGASVSRKTKISTGLVRKDKFDWSAAASRIAASRQYSTAVISFGANDLISFRGPTVHYGDPRWANHYADRVSEVVRNLRAGGMRVIWVGIPIVRKDRHQKDYAKLNEIFRRAAQMSGAVYVDTWNALAVNGQYSVHGADANGKQAVLRHTDGVHFTPQGYVRYGQVVLNAMRARGLI